MESLLDLLRAWPGAVWLRGTGTAYLFVNAAHILGIALTLGAILPLDLRLMGFIRHGPLDVVGPFLVRTAASGLALAILTGAWLFSVKPADYLANDAFLWKLALLALALVNILLQHRHHPFGTEQPGGIVRLHAALSATFWLGILLAGRWIGFL